MAVTYDAALVHTHVKELYRSANNAVVTYTMFGVAFGLTGQLVEIARSL